MSRYALIDPVTGEATHVSAKPQHIQRWAQARQGHVVVDGDQDARASGASYDLENGEWVEPTGVPETHHDQSEYREPSAMVRAKISEIADFEPVPVPENLKAPIAKPESLK